MEFRIKVLLALCLFWFGYAGESFGQSVKNTPCPSKSSEGVVLYGCNSSSGWIENTNKYAVRIRHVWQFNGETTLWINRIEPGERLQIGDAGAQNGFYIYTMDGVMVGWFTGSCPRQK
jgi:hypothetical protein